MNIRWWHWLLALSLALALEGLLVWAFGVFTTGSAPAGAGQAITRISLGRPLVPEAAVRSGPVVATAPTIPSAPATAATAATITAVAAARVKQTPEKTSEAPVLPPKFPAQPELSTKLPQAATTPRKPSLIPAAPQADATKVPVDATFTHASASALQPDPAPEPEPEPEPISRAQAQRPAPAPGMSGSAAVAPPQVPAMSAAGMEVEKNAYRAKLVARLAAKRRYPVLAQRSGQEGEVAVSFELAADGSVRSRRLVKTSGYALLDQAGLATVDRASPFPSVPDAFGAGPFRFTVPLRFDLR